MDAWVVSIHLRKAFDRVEHKALFHALEHHGLSHDYRQLLQELYRGQIGALTDEIWFDINRGVRQGDVLSPLLFNCALEKAISDWKSQLNGHGFALSQDGAEERLTNSRFADDLLISGKSMEEALSMMEMLVVTLRNFGLELNVKRTKNDVHYNSRE